MKLFRTHDLSLAATIMHEKFPLLELDRSGRKVEFVFEDTEKLKHMISTYWRDELQCSALSLLTSYRRAKHILYESR